MYNFLYKICKNIKLKFYHNFEKNIDIKISEENYFSIIDYCTICDNVNLNKYFIYHCNKCNSCHIKNKLFCIQCKQCYNPNIDNDIIKHRKMCVNFIR